MLDTLTRSRIRTGAQHLHKLGPLALAEFIEDLTDRIGGVPAIVALLNEYAYVAPSRGQTASRHRMTSGKVPPR